MARKKIVKAKPKKRTATKQAKIQKSPSLIDKMEKTLKEFTGKLSNQCRTELATLKKHDIRLKTDLKKAQQQLAMNKKKQTALAKAKTATAKKQLATSKKDHSTLTLSIKDLNTRLQQNKNNTKHITNKQKQFTALGKHLSNLDKLLGTTKPKTATKRKKTRTQTTFNQPKERKMEDLPFITLNKTETELG